MSRSYLPSALLAAVPRQHLLADPDTVAPYLHDEAEWAPYGRAIAVVRPGSTAEVAAVVIACAEHGIPVVTRGAGTGLSGGANAVDGNLHPLTLTPHGDAAARIRTQAAFDDIVDAALDLGGTVTGEHGVGLLKRDGALRELGPTVVAMHRAVKAALDPHGILNPGKVIG